MQRMPVYLVAVVILAIYSQVSKFSCFENYKIKNLSIILRFIPHGFQNLAVIYIFLFLSNLKVFQYLLVTLGIHKSTCTVCLQMLTS